MKFNFLNDFKVGRNNNPAKRKKPFSIVHIKSIALIKKRIFLFLKKKYIDINESNVNGNAKLTTPAWPMNKGENKNREADNNPI